MQTIAANRRSFFQHWLDPLGSEPPTEPFVTVARRSMGCWFELQFPGQDPSAVDSGCRALEIVESLDRRLTVYSDSSEVARVNRRAFDEPLPVSPALANLIRLARKIAEDTGGAFDYTCGAMIRAWGFVHGPKRVPGAEDHGRCLATGGYRNLLLEDGRVRSLAKGLELNWGAIGKGYAIDCALAQLRNRALLMQAGGSSTRARGTQPGEPRGWQVSIGRRVRVWLRNQALGTSAADRQFFVADGRRFGHILDPRTGWPANAVRSASALAKSAARADALSTAFFVLGLEGARDYCRKHPEIGAIIVSHSGKTYVFGDCDVEVN